MSPIYIYEYTSTVVSDIKSNGTVSTAEKCIYRDVLVGECENGNEHVDEDDDHAAAVRSKHEFADELCQLLRQTDRKLGQPRQSVACKVHCLHHLKQATSTIGIHYSSSR